MAQVKDFTPAELDEIRTSYRQAKNQRTQIDVLADLYACTRQDIERALGLPETPKRENPRNRNKYFKWTPELEERLIALYAQEASPSKAAALLGVPERKVRNKVLKLRQSGRLPPAERPPARCADAAEDAPVLQECSAPREECDQTQEATGAPDHTRYGDLIIERAQTQEAARAEKPDKSPPALAVLAELDELLSRAAEIAHALRVLSERGGGA